MTGLDTSQAELAEPPLEPTEVTAEVLAATARRIAQRATTMGLRQWFWGEGVVLLGLIRLADALGEPVPPFVTDFVDGHLRTGIELGHVNNLIPGAACARLLADTGDERYANACEQMLSWLDATTGTGVIEHWPGGVWADTAFMAGVFLIHCGQSLDRPELIAEAGSQLVAHAEVLRDLASGLYAHGSHQGETIWCFWGRANAWIALAGVEFLEAGGEADQVRPMLEQQLLTLADLQPKHGIWDVLVDSPPETRGIVETSAAAGIAAAMFRAAKLGIAPDRLRESAWRAISGLHSYIAEDGTLTRTSAGTVLQLVPFGYSVIRNDRIQPWGQGLALHAYAAALADSVGCEPRVMTCPARRRP